MIKVNFLSVFPIDTLFSMTIKVFSIGIADVSMSPMQPRMQSNMDIAPTARSSTATNRFAKWNQNH